MSERSRLSDRDLQATFADKDVLVEKKLPFMISDYSERTGSYEGKPRQESVFTIFLITGPEAGYDQLLTVTVTAARQRVGKLIKQFAPRGPVILQKLTKDKDGKKRANPVFVFVPVTDAKVIKAADALVAKLASEGLDTSGADADESDLPF